MSCPDCDKLKERVVDFLSAHTPHGPAICEACDLIRDCAPPKPVDPWALLERLYIIGNPPQNGPFDKEIQAALAAHRKETVKKPEGFGE